MGPTLGGIRERHWNIVILLCCYRLFECLQTKSPEQTKKYIMNELLNYSMSDKQRETCESDQRLPRFLWGCQWQHAYLSEKARSHRVHGSAFMCLSNSLGSLPLTCVFFVHAQAGADLALKADEAKVWASQTGKIQEGKDAGQKSLCQTSICTAEGVE